MKILFTIIILFAFTLVSAQENKKTNTETITVRKEKQVDKYKVYYRNYTGVATIPKKELEEMDILTVRPTDSINPIVVVSFEISLIAKGNLYTATSKGNALSKDAKEVLRLAPIGTKVFIDNVLGENKKTKEIRKLQGMTIKVK